MNLFVRQIPVTFPPVLATRSLGDYLIEELVAQAGLLTFDTAALHARLESGRLACRSNDPLVSVVGAPVACEPAGNNTDASARDSERETTENAAGSRPRDRPNEGEPWLEFATKAKTEPEVVNALGYAASRTSSLATHQ